MVALPRWRPRWPALAVAAVALVAAGFAGSFGLASYYADKSPFVALQFDGANGAAAGKAVALLQAAEPETYSLSANDRAILLEGLRRDPLSKVVLRAFGISAMLAKREDRARVYMELAQRVSRRDAPTQIWMISDKARGGDLPGTIAHYDKALSISPSASNALFPSLTEALAYPEIDPQLAPYLRDGRSWADAFVLYATTYVDRAADLGRVLYAATPLPPSREREVILRQVVGRYASQGDIRGARTFAARMMGAEPAVFDNFALTDETSSERFVPLTWSVPGSGTIVAALTEEGGVEVVAAPDTSGPILTRALYLSPGPYRLEHAVAYPEEGEPVSLEWRALCLRGETGKVFWSQTVPALAQDSRYSMDMRVPANCSGVRFTLSVRDTDRTSQAYIVVSDFSLTGGRQAADT